MKQYGCFICVHFRAHALCIKNMHNLEEQAEDMSGAQPKQLPPYGARQNKFHLVEADGGQGDRVPLIQIASA